MAVTMLKETIKSYTLKGSNVYSAFLDLSKAFDKVNHNILMSKLMKTNASPSIIQTLIDMYNKQFVRVCFNNVKGDFWRLGNGVRQGGIISPLLFNLYINDAIKEISSCDIGCKLGIFRHNTQRYADDLTLLSPSPDGLQFLLNKLFIKLTELNLTLNAKKSLCLIFGRHNKINRNQEVAFYINGVQISIVSSCRYLGVILTSNLSCKEDILRSEASFTKQFYCIYRKFKFADTRTLTFLFKTHCMSLYSSELWYDLKGSQTVFNDHATSYHNCVKQLFNQPSWKSNHAACDKTGLPIFKHLISWKNFSFVLNLMKTQSASIARHKYYITMYSDVLHGVRQKFKDAYQIGNVYTDDIEAILSRISFVQDRENRSDR